ncbi:MAG: hypothetical protein CK431_16965 [Mycobacterium sp.]|nr:MAG: hypothetical protein CK431_16965 [Mycobacterium sp.]
MGTAEMIVALVGSNAVTAGVTTWLKGRPSMVGAMTQAYTQIATRVGTLEVKVSALESKLGTEQLAHAGTREELHQERAAHMTTKGLLGRALAYIREVVNWERGDRIMPLPTPTVELLRESL